MPRWLFFASLSISLDYKVKLPIMLQQRSFREKVCSLCFFVQVHVLDSCCSNWGFRGVLFLVDANTQGVLKILRPCVVLDLSEKENMKQLWKT